MTSDPRPSGTPGPWDARDDQQEQAAPPTVPIPADGPRPGAPGQPAAGPDSYGQGQPVPGQPPQSSPAGQAAFSGWFEGGQDSRTGYGRGAQAGP
ncbi:MAG TPA: hypothetical protein VHF26_11120, partial [Trebonia sp.]|nr:hypothetical protein [Trebonia sp.]